MSRSFEGSVVVITGAAGGIGLATAKAFLAEGARVHLVDLREQVLLEADDLGAQARGHTADVTDPDAMAALAEAVQAEDGHADVLVNNAGVCQARPLGRLTFEAQPQPPHEIPAGLLRIGDLVDDGAVNIQDLSLVAGHYDCKTPVQHAADLDQDGLVCDSDLELVSASFGLVEPSAWAP